MPELFSCLLCLQPQDVDQLVTVMIPQPAPMPPRDVALCRSCVSEIALAAQNIIRAGADEEPNAEDV